MILKGNQRAFGSDLASHLLNLYDNEEVEVAELTQTHASDLHGAFAEFEAVATGTRAKEPLYSLSINPAQPLTRDQYFEAINRIEDKLGLSGQPRAVVFHRKNGKDGALREHCHVVWSRIDIERMKAVPLSHDRQKLRTMAQQLGQEFGHPLPDGLARNRGGGRFGEARDFDVTAQAQAQRSGLKADERRAVITAAFRESKDGAAFEAALEEQGFLLARGDKRGFVVVDRAGQVHSLPRQIDGARTKDVATKLAPRNPDDLPDVKSVRARLAKMAEDEALDADELPVLRRSEEELRQRQAARRAALTARMQELEIRQREERLTLHKAQESERKNPFARAARIVLSAVQKVPVLRTVLGPLASKPVKNLDDRHRQENEALDARYERERQPLAGQAKALKLIEQRENRSFAFDKRQVRRAEALKEKRTDDKQAAFRKEADEMTKAQPPEKPDRQAEFRENADGLTQHQKDVKRRMEEAERVKRTRTRTRKPRGPGMS